MKRIPFNEYNGDENEMACGWLLGVLVQKRKTRLMYIIATKIFVGWVATGFVKLDEL